MKKLTFFAGCLLLFGSLLGSGSTYAQSFMNGGANVTIGDDALVSVYGLTRNGGTITVRSKGMVNLHGDLTLHNGSEFKLLSTSEKNTASLIGYATTVTNDGSGIIRSQRYITGSATSGTDASDGKWHYFTSPVNGDGIENTWVTTNKIAFHADGSSALDFWRWDEPESFWYRYNNSNFNGATITNKFDHDYHSTFESGKGYIAAVKADGRATQGTLEFEGKTFNGPGTTNGVNVPVFSDGKDSIQPGVFTCWKGWNLIGNPYPSAYNIKKWLAYNADPITHIKPELDDCHQAVYLFIERKKDDQQYGGPGNNSYFCNIEDYHVISNNGSNYDFSYYYLDQTGNLKQITGNMTDLGTDYVSVGQGFFIKVKDDYDVGHISFPVGTSSDQAYTNANGINGVRDSENYRAHDFLTFFRGGDREESPWPSFAILVNDKEGNASSSVVSFNEEMTTHLDPSYDVSRLANPYQSVSVYTDLLEKDSECGELAMQALPFVEQKNRGNEEDLLPETGYVIPVGLDVKKTMNVNFNVAEDQLDDQAIVLEDRKLNVFTDMKTDHYATTADKSENGYGRFYIHFGPKSENISSDNLQITAYMLDKHQLQVLNPGTVVGDYQIFDVNGSLLYNGHLNGNDEQIIHVDLAMGMYLLHVNTAARSQAFKFINK